METLVIITTIILMAVFFNPLPEQLIPKGNEWYEFHVCAALPGADIPYFLYLFTFQLSSCPN